MNEMQKLWLNAAGYLPPKDESTKYGKMNDKETIPKDGTKVLAYAWIEWDDRKSTGFEWVIVQRIKTPLSWIDDVIHDRDGHALRCDVVGWFPLPSLLR